MNEYHCIVTIKDGSSFKADLGDTYIDNLRECDGVKSVKKGKKVK